MHASVDDRDYARYMLEWIGALEWPEFPLAEAELPALRGYWLVGDEADLDAIATRLWAWVDAHGGAGPSVDPRMLLARMLICVASEDNRELQRRGWFEELLARRGVAAERIAARTPGTRHSASQGADAAQASSDEAFAVVRLQRMKAQVLLAFGATSFVSGATASPSPQVSGLEMLWVLLMAWLIWLWYRIDSTQLGFRRTPGLGVLVVLVAAVGIPLYLVRSRGWPQARLAVLQAIGLFLASVLLSALGASLFALPAEAP